MEGDTGLGPFGLFNELCRRYIDDESTSNLFKPKRTKEIERKNLKIKVYDTLFRYLRSHDRAKDAKPHPQMTELDKLFAHAYELRTLRRFDDANRLEQLVELLDRLEGGELALVKVVLQFLLCLAGTGPKKKEKPLGHAMQKLPSFQSGKKSTAVLPSGPLNYGDTKLKNPYEPHYMHYPRHIFEVPADSIMSEVPPATKMVAGFVCNCLPGTNLSTDFFSVKGILNDAHEKRTSSSLFGALVNARTTALNMKLELPDLEGDLGISSYSLSRLTETNLSPDEGFETNSSVSVASASLAAAPAEDIWEQALHYVPSKHHTWEKRGSVAGPTEKPYLTEAGPQAFDNLYTMRDIVLRLMDEKHPQLKPRCISMKSLVRDVLFLLTGVESKTFLFDQEKEAFYMKPGIRLSGVSAEALTELCAELIECGSNFWRLQKFSAPPVLNSLYTKGLVFQAFTVAIRKYLQHYQACVLMVPHNKTIMELNFLFHKIKLQMRFLAELCMCSTSQPGKQSPTSDFPTGVRLLSYLYQLTVDSCSSDNYPMMLCILHTSCGPYIKFIQNWVYHGICSDIYEEFMLRVNDDYLFCRDKHYWTSGYEMMSPESEECVPLFLKDLASEIFVCGKSINLLKLCCPRHFMCNLEEEIIPHVSISFSEAELTMLYVRCQAYVSRMDQIARQKILTRADMLQRAERAKMDLIQKARKAAAEEMDRLQARIIEMRRAVDAKKRQAFKELKNQMEQDRERRNQDIAREKQEDKERIDALTKVEGAEMTEEQLLEQQAREELIAYYSKLTEEAARREQRALWKVRRGKLHQARRNFLQNDDHLLDQEMTLLKSKSEDILQEADGKHKLNVSISDAPTSNLLNTTLNRPPGVNAGEARNLLDMSIPYLPLSTSVIGSGSSSVDSALDRAVVQQEANVVDGKNLLDVSIEDLPNWAQKTIKDSHVISDNLFSQSSLPNWAQKGGPGIHASPGTLVVTDKDAEAETDVAEHVDKDSTMSLINLDESVKLPQWAQLNFPSEQVISVDDVDNGTNVLEQKSESKEATHAMKAESSNVGDGRENVNLLSNRPSSESHIIAVKMVEGVHVTFETEESVQKPQMGLSKERQATEETEEVAGKFHIKTVPGEHITYESQGMPLDYQYTPPLLRTPEEIYDDLHNESPGFEIRQSRRKSNSLPKPRNILGVNISKESEQVDEGIKKQTKFKAANVHGHHSDESKGTARDSDALRVQKFKEQNVHGHTTQETVEKVAVFSRNVHGHSSQCSEFVDFDAVRRKKFKEHNTFGHISRESTDSDTDGVKFRKFRQQNVHGHVSEQQLHSDVDQIRQMKFKERNIHGHSSDSTIQRLLYGEKFGQKASKTEEDKDTETFDKTVFESQSVQEISVWADEGLELYQDHFDTVNDPPMVDVAHKIFDSPFTLTKYLENVDSHSHMSLPVLLKQSITTPLLAQISLVNRSIVSYFLHDLEIGRHFEALRMYLFLEDGEFGQTLSEHLFDKMASNPKPQELFNPVFLNGVLAKALRSSIHGDSTLAKSVTFLVKHIPQILHMNTSSALTTLELTYKVDWPLNIVITDNCLTKYGKVFTFMLQLKRTVWTLKDIWHRLIRDPVLSKAKNVPQVRQLQLFRHEMQYFVKVMQGYISNQIIHVTWKEFQDDLLNYVSSLDDLHDRHAEYLNKAVFRCLLNKKAAPVMKIIQDIFTLILRFHCQLVSSSWQHKHKTGEIYHPSFSNMVATYKSFKDYSLFLFKVVNKLAIRGYQQHLEEFLLRLNFNQYYSELHQ